MSEYVELHCHSSFSLLDGASLPAALVSRAKSIGYNSLAITDHDDLGGVVKFSEAAREAGIGGIIGVELTVNIESMGNTHITLLAESCEGYSNISQLVTYGRTNSPRGIPSVPISILEKYTDGVYALTGCINGWVSRLIRSGEKKDAGLALATLYDYFDGRVAVEVWDHGLLEERSVVAELISLARQGNIPWVVTNNVHYAERSQRCVHDVLSSIRHGRILDEMGTLLRPNAEWYLKSAEEMSLIWNGYEEGLYESVRIAERCSFRLSDLRMALPVFSLPPGVSANQHLECLVEEGAHNRWGSTGVRSAMHDKQIKRELDLIKKLDLAGYFLIVWDIVKFAHREGILCQGRGSAANSAVCYCLGITAVDPISMNLLFERFLSENRTEPPDIDIDFAHRDRERVLQYVYRKYGRDNAAMVCEQITYRGRSAIRDVAKALGLSADQGIAISSASDRRSLSKNIPEDIASLAGLDINDERVNAIASIAEQMRHIPRHRSIHTGGFVLSRNPVAYAVPIEHASMKDRTVIQWEKDDLGPVGMIKIDLLGLGILTVVQECLKHIYRIRGVDLDMASIPKDDSDVYDDICAADTIGVFQIESRAQMNTLPRLKPRCFYDLVIEVALIRPGPIQGDMVHPYLRRRAGVEPITYPHPSVEDILRRTLGVPLFQEQGMRVAIEVAGFSADDADRLRRAMGHKRSAERMEELRVQLMQGMQKNGISYEMADRVYRQITGFADYGFPESHAASFALIAYSTAYLRHHYAPEYLCAMLNAQPMGFYSPSTLIQDAQRRGVEVRPIDIRYSSWKHTLEEGDNSIPVVRIGMCLIQGLGSKARRNIESALSNAPFANISDFIQRVNLDRTAIQKIVESGAFDGLFEYESIERRRRSALWHVLAIQRGEAGPLISPSITRAPAAVRPMTSVQKIAMDYKSTGMSLAGHPLSHLRSDLDEKGVITSKSCITESKNGDLVIVAGVVICRQRPPTAKGFMFITLEDETGLLNVVLKPDVYEKNAKLISNSKILLIEGLLERESNVVNVKAMKLTKLYSGSGEEYVEGYNFR